MFFSLRLGALVALFAVFAALVSSTAPVRFNAEATSALALQDVCFGAENDRAPAGGGHGEHRCVLCAATAAPEVHQPLLAVLAVLLPSKALFPPDIAPRPFHALTDRPSVPRAPPTPA